MVSIVLASHGDLAEGLKMTGSMVFGDQPNVATVSLMPSMGPDDFRQKVEEAVASFDDPEDVLFLVDLWGGTPFNQSMMIANDVDKLEIVTGSNLPMIIELLFARNGATDVTALAEQAVTVGQQAVTRQSLASVMGAADEDTAEDGI